MILTISFYAIILFRELGLPGYPGLENKTFSKDLFWAVGFLSFQFFLQHPFLICLWFAHAILQKLFTHGFRFDSFSTAFGPHLTQISFLLCCWTRWVVGYFGAPFTITYAVYDMFTVRIRVYKMKLDNFSYVEHIETACNHFDSILLIHL